MEDYHLASGAATNWGKTEGLRLGSLRGVAPSDAVLGDPRVGNLAMPALFREATRTWGSSVMVGVAAHAAAALP